MVRVKVPATTANMGPGFDALGMALSIYNYIEVIPTDEGVETLVESENLHLELEENLIYQAIKRVYDKVGESFGGFKIHVYKCDVPMSRGLGSSATCIVGGILAANELLGGKLSEQEMLEIANSMEGHPDNVAPALLGGMVASVQEDGKVYYSKVSVPSEVLCAVMVPNFKVSTNEARGVLPTSYSREDCVFNISRASLFISALHNGEIDTLRHVVQDRIHEPYRGKLIPNIDEVFQASKDAGGLCEFISGSGSTLLAFVHRDNSEYLENMKSVLGKLDNEWTIQIVSPNFEGASVVK
ncbi:homoserine kinase [Clostridium cylindrosporum]|uniref:Homoserine kinase n=1 Tax=Clostridium cylindrosporum DSM 605 TaxID=1121307 RepID=A0A0J8DFJ6_CLOCY|nr:homoserine kinase [Clostridium cylindrosporum]KMT22953.1 homoserine kinase ThrB [Clostridium cylindrosporum DSM 605]